jgi:hypothetical protein
LPGGAGRAVTAESKAEYVSLVVDWHLRGAVAPLLGPMLAGLWEVVPAQHLQGFSAPELAYGSCCETGTGAPAPPPGTCSVYVMLGLL